MHIERKKYSLDAAEKLSHCLDKITAADGFSGNLSWKSEIVPGLTVEEIIGAMVAAERELDDARDEIRNLCE